MMFVPVELVYKLSLTSISYLLMFRSRSIIIITLSEILRKLNRELYVFRCVNYMCFVCDNHANNVRTHTFLMKLDE